jgi:hypothetical protein
VGRFAVRTSSLGTCVGGRFSVGGFAARTERVLKSNEGAFFRGDLLVGFEIRDVLDLVRVRWAMGTWEGWTRMAVGGA